MRNKNRDFKSVEDFQNLRDALSIATNTHRNHNEEQTDEYSYQPTIDDMSDDSSLAFTDTMFMHAGMGLSQLGVQIGLEAPSSLQEVHRRGELFMFASLGAVALIEASKAATELF